MSARKVFFKSFFYSLLIIISLYFILLFLINNQPTVKEIDTNQEGVRILSPDVDDSKNILVVFEGFENRFYYILNLNGIQNKVSFMSVDKDFYLNSIEKTLDESFETAGVMQSSFDLSREFLLTIDYYLTIDYQTAISLSKDFKDMNIKSISDGMPEEIKSLLLSSQEEIDINSLINLISKGENILAESEGLSYFNSLLFFILRDNILDIDEEFISTFKDSFSYVETNINTIAIEKIKKINSFFSMEETMFLTEVILENDENYLEKIDYLYSK